MSVKVLYRNVFCALCNDEYRFVFFNVEIFSRRVFNVEELRNTSAIRNRLREAQFHRKYRYRHPAGFQTRPCVPAISACPTAWTDDVMRNNCQGPMALVRDAMTGQVYRNDYCAICNGINTTRLSCESRQALVTLKFPPTPDFPLPYSLLIDVNRGFLRRRSAIVGYVRQPEVVREVTPICRTVFARGTNLSAETWVSTLFSDGSCDEVECPDGYELSSGNHVTCLRPESLQNETYAFKFDPGLGYLTLTGNCLSMCGLALLLCVYGSLNCLRNLPGKCLMSLSVSLLLSQLLFTLAGDKTDNRVLCLAVGVLDHYMFLVYALWMNVMAVDVWKAFCRGSTTFRELPYSTRNTFALYSAYAWLTPILLVTSAVVADVTELGVRPHYGERFCWINDKTGLLAFFGIPLACVVVVNCVFFLQTLYNIQKTAKCASRILRQADDVASNSAAARCRFVLYVKLAVVLAVTWLFGLLATAIDHVILWYVFTIANAFQGLYICVAFVFTRKVYRSAMLRIRRLASSRSRASFAGSATKETNDSTKSSRSQCQSRTLVSS